MKSFEEIYEKYYKKLYFFLYKLSGDPSLAEEITQETLYKAFLHIEQYQGRSNIFTWLCKIAKNNWLAECKMQKRFQKIDEVWEPVSRNNVEQEVVERQMIALMREEMKRLPEPYNTVCILKIYAELSYKEIALEFKKSESWARVTFFRGKSMIVERMKKQQ